MNQKLTYWINADGSTITVSRQPKPPTLRAMQDFVGGYVEHVNILFHGIQAHMFVHEEGRRLFAARNEPATLIYFAASRSRGHDPEDPEASKAQMRQQAARLGIALGDVVVLGDDGRAPGIYGPAVVLLGFDTEEM